MSRCTLENVARAGALFTAGYPTAKRMDEGTIRVWTEALQGFSGSAVEMAAKQWITTEKHFPTLAGFIEAIRAQDSPRDFGPRPECFVCDEGWVTVSEDGRSTVARCPNGCLPPHPEEVRQPVEDVRPQADRGAFVTARAALEEARKAISRQRVPEKSKPKSGLV